MGKLIFLDIDGTLVPAGCNEPPESALAAIRAAQGNGHKVLLCSGRNKAMLSPLLKYGFDGYVASAGGYVVVGNEVIYAHPMTQDEFETAMKYLRAAGAVCTVECRDASYGDHDLEEFVKAAGEGNSELIRWRKAIVENLSIRPIEEYDGEPVFKIVVMVHHDEDLDPVRRALGKDFDLRMMDNPVGTVRNGELSSLVFDKGSGIRAVCDYLGVPIEDTVGFGDQMNDLEMIEVVGTSVCMANGSEKLKAICDLVTGDVNEDGLAEGFRTLGMC